MRIFQVGYEKNLIIFYVILLSVFAGLLLHLIPVRYVPSEASFALFLIIFASSLIITVTLFRPDLGLILALISMYNPYYVHLARQGWENAYIRASVSSAFLLLLFLVVVIIKRHTRFKTPIDRLIIFFSIFPLLYAVLGAFKGYETRLILADLFPWIEFPAYFFITTLVIKKRKEIDRLLLIVLLMIVVTGTTEIFYYLKYGSNFYYFGALIGGKIIPRIPDFLAPMLLPIMVTTFIYANPKKLKMLLCLAILISLFVTIFSFFRSLWLSTMASFIFIFWMLDNIRKKNFIVNTIGISLLILLIGNFFIAHNVAIEGQSLWELIGGRSGQIAESLLLTTPKEAQPLRLSNIGAILNTVAECSWLGKGLGEPLFANAFNYFAKIAIWMGLPVLIFFLLLNYFLFRKGVLIFKSLFPSPYKGIILGFLASYVFVGFMCLSFPSVLRFPIPAYLGTAIALVFIIYRIEQKDQKHMIVREKILH